jgi:hypothetical protein
MLPFPNVFSKQFDGLSSAQPCLVWLSHVVPRLGAGASCTSLTDRTRPTHWHGRYPLVDVAFAPHIPESPSENLLSKHPSDPYAPNPTP